MRRIAWFSPLPPTDSPIARMSAALLPELARRCSVDTYVERLPAEPVPGVHVAPADDFIHSHDRDPYDAVVYHVADEMATGFVWAPAAVVPGLVVLHTLAPHRGRFAWLDAHAQLDRYAAEFAAAYPSFGPAGTRPPIPLTHPLLGHAWPLRAPILALARAIAVHDAAAAEQIALEIPATPIVTVRIAAVAREPRPTRADARAALGVPREACVFGSLAPLGTPPHAGVVVDVFRQIAARHPSAWLVLGEEVSPGAPGADAARVRQVAANGEAARALVRAASDVGLALEWPRAGDDAPHDAVAWLASGVPLLALDRPATSGWPLVNPQSWQPHALAVAGRPLADAIGVAVPVDDEIHSLLLAMDRFAKDAPWREALARAAAAWAAGNATPTPVAEDYARAIEATVAAPPRPTPTGV